MTKPERARYQQEIIRYLESKEMTSDGQIYNMIDYELFNHYKSLKS